MKYDWYKEVKEIEKYTAMTRQDLKALYNKDQNNLNVKYALMERYYIGLEIEEMDEDDLNSKVPSNIPHLLNSWPCFNIVKQYDKNMSKQMLSELIKAEHGSSIVFFTNAYKLDNVEQQINMLNKAIDIGFLSAIDNLSQIYKVGKLQNYDEYLKILKRGMDLDYAQSYFDYAATKEGEDKKDELLHYAADVLDYGRAQYVLAKGYEFENNYEKAFEYMCKSANNYNCFGMVSLGEYFLNGIGTNKDIENAIKWFKTAIEYGEQNGRHLLGKLYLQIGKEKEAFELFYQNRENNDDSLYELGKCYRDGVGCKVDEKEAFKCFDKIAKEPSNEYLIDLIECYYKGIGTEQNYYEAYSYLNQIIKDCPYDSYPPKKFYTIKKGLEELRCPHCGKFDTKTTNDDIEVCSVCGGAWNEMTFNSEKKLGIEEIDIDGFDGIKLFKVGDCPYYSNSTYIYTQDDFEDNRWDFDKYESYYIWDTKKDIYEGGFVCQLVKNTENIPYANKGDEVLIVKAFAYTDQRIFDATLKGLDIVSKAMFKNAIFNTDDKKYADFYDKLLQTPYGEQVGNCIVMKHIPFEKEYTYGNFKIRYTEFGEEHEIDIATPRYIEDGETYLGYIISDDLRFLRGGCCDFIVAHNNKTHTYMGYSIGEIVKVTDHQTYNCYFIKEFFVDTEDESKYDFADKIFELINDSCKYCYVKYIKIKINDNEHYSYFYDYCKDKLNFIKKEGYLIKEINY